MRNLAFILMMLFSLVVIAKDNKKDRAAWDAMNSRVKFNYVTQIELEGQYYVHLLQKIKAIKGQSSNVVLNEEQSKVLDADENFRSYVSGVLDSTEGKTWCDYNHQKAIIFDQIVIPYLLNLSIKRLEDRAAKLIEEAAVKKFSCNQSDVDYSGKIKVSGEDFINKKYIDRIKNGQIANAPLTEEQQKIADKRAVKNHAYILGILDASEGKTWCGYYQFNPPYYHSIAFRYLESLPEQRLKENAAKLIEEGLIKKLPCRN